MIKDGISLIFSSVVAETTTGQANPWKEQPFSSCFFSSGFLGRQAAVTRPSRVRIMDRGQLDIC